MHSLSLGSFGDDTLQLVPQLRAESGDAREATWLTQRIISVAIQRGNAASVLPSQPLPPTP